MLPEYVILIAFPLKQWLRERASVFFLKRYIAQKIQRDTQGCDITAVLATTPVHARQ
jgi:hypothetical protein